jgi:ribosome biogenesis GTPase A
MTRARRQMQEDVRLVDLVIELTDARTPLSGRNPDIDSLAAGKSRILVLNKSDLADPEQNKAWTAYFRKNGLVACEVNARSGNGIRQIRPMIAEACREKIERDRSRGIMNRPLRAMIAGIPNVGKSTFINSFAGKASAKTGNKPGVTRGRQWISVERTLQLLDTPGILWPRFDDRQVGIRLAEIGCIRDEILDAQELACELISWIRTDYPQVLSERYGISQEGTAFEVLGRIAEARKCLKAGGEPDCGKAAALLLDEFRSGRLGRMTLEKAPD